MFNLKRLVSGQDDQEQQIYELFCRLSKDSDFNGFLSVLEADLARLDKENRKLLPPEIYASQGAAQYLESLLESIQKAELILAEMKAQTSKETPIDMSTL